jgi:hypothetical protein
LNRNQRIRVMQPKHAHTSSTNSQGHKHALLAGNLLPMMPALRHGRQNAMVGWATQQAQWLNAQFGLQVIPGQRHTSIRSMYSLPSHTKRCKQNRVTSNAATKHIPLNQHTNTR